ncbi:UDP-N-acetylglucosamine 2-epimerase (non-hydrolyzing) [bacterium]|nr:UDP-N-acetylglucosamine 2-epimerase (non-hydrolyzing) [Candidatus Omnitrophota bacterium]MBU2528239.1 UDP-N-acetylglucosamine 2-epimerase (non-hydrolyzing) [bacterium]MBU3929617.1 UDP-N-acetylglucosamine 2-epimerase (non-hydrolyzing) [bacterium]MBU4122202.1 UDP-N-acetylglucosamine 2-epimerase (non-hydrolyzing) [bacterium]
MRKKIILTFGTRPEAIKMAPVYLALKKDSAFSVKLALTGQHSDMLDEALDIFGMKPEYNLNIMTAAQSLADITSSVVKRLDAVYKKEKPDMVLVHGDTSTTFASALAAFYNGIPSAHVEAGLRTGNKNEPFPEELNRVLTDSISDILFPPTKGALLNIKREGLRPALVSVTGNTIVDAAGMISRDEMAVTDSVRRLAEKPFVLFTMHRRESWGKPMEGVFDFLKKYFTSARGVSVVYPVHPNPAVKNTAEKILGLSDNIVLTAPLNYRDLIYLLKNCLFAVTDSGGIQEEALVFGKKVVLLRERTERPEGVTAGFVKVAGTSSSKIRSCISGLLKDSAAKKTFRNPYGDGRASERIVGAIRKYFGLRVLSKIKDFE